MSIFRKITLIILSSVAILVLSCVKKDAEKIEQKPKKENNIYYKSQAISKGESIYQVLLEMGVSHQEVARFTHFMGQYVDFTSIQIGDSLKVKFKKIKPDTTLADSLQFEPCEKVEELTYIPDIITSHILQTKNDSLIYKKNILPYETKKRIIQGEIDKNLTNSLKKQNLSRTVRQQIIKPLEAIISFETDARPHDKYKVLIEEKFYEGEKLPGARIIYSSYQGKRIKKKEAYRFQDDKESSALNGMYTIKGKALVVGAVRTPLDYMHVTSGFGKRIHPITGRWKFHAGTDYRASRGTPVYAVAKGRVIKSRWNGGYGNEVRIRHLDGSITHYAHLSRRYVSRGKYVRKGQKIGAVGTTGFSTGPHLHFGLMKYGRWRNPKNLKMVGAHKLKGTKLQEYKKQIETIQNEISYFENQKKESHRGV